MDVNACNNKRQSFVQLAHAKGIEAVNKLLAISSYLHDLSALFPGDSMESSPFICAGYHLRRSLRYEA